MAQHYLSLPPLCQPAQRPIGDLRLVCLEEVKLADWVLERLRQERTEDEAERLWRQCVHGCSLVAMIAEGVVGLCLIGGNSLEAELLALWVAPEGSFHDVGQALLSRCFDQF